MPDGIRAFLAVTVPPGVRRAVDAAARRLKGAMPGARFVPAGQLHLTLHFFESLEPGEVEAAKRAASAGAAAFPRFDASLAGLGVFPDERRPRVLWAGVRDGAEALVHLASAIGQRLAAEGLPVEGRPFRPHLTIARFREPPRGGIPGVLAGSRDTPFGTFPVERVVLYRSVLSPQGAVHTAISEHALGGRDG
jgi:2'-5' RNA ligase